MAFELCSKNGSILPIDQAQISVTSVEAAYGFGVYEHVRVQRGHPYFLDEHCERLHASARIIGLAHPFETPSIECWCRELIDRCPADALNLKMLLYGGRDRESATLFLIPLQPFFPDRRLWRTGASTITVHYERPFPEAKTLSMLGSYLAYRQAKEAGAYDALLIDREGRITEGTRTNFFVLRGRTIIGAPAERILRGVTMTHVLRVAASLGFSIETADIRISDIPSIDGAFLTSTSSGILPIRSIDAQTVQISDDLRFLMTSYDDAMRQLMA